ncbi:hypothetical protein L3Q82_015650 [Scortum barcoo]|uniref:Uncharacterized protein n=1 Tax=Scortum barcoo TaxID=214431 RepID=A0ACB8VQK5_9TELE|nr:hypothetical protein L3Q82_015650 [Scortum barcoo]
MGVLSGHAQDPSSRRPRFQLQATTCYQLQHLPLQALVDSGAEENFLDLQVATRAGVPFELLEKPRDALAVDGRIMARFTHRTQPLTLVSPGWPPTTHIWTGPEGKLLDWSFRCHETCSRSALSPATEPAGPCGSPKPVDLSGVPEEYHDLKEVFNKDKAFSLPPHHPYDCTIDLIPGSSLPSSRLYHLSRPESEAMEKYIRESLAAWPHSTIQGSTGSRVFLCRKKRLLLYAPALIIPSLPLQGAVIFTKLDLRNAYHRCASAEEMSGKLPLTLCSVILSTWSCLSASLTCASSFPGASISRPPSPAAAFRKPSRLIQRRLGRWQSGRFQPLLLGPYTRPARSGLPLCGRSGCVRCRSGSCSISRRLTSAEANYDVGKRELLEPPAASTSPSPIARPQY